MWHAPLFKADTKTFLPLNLFEKNFCHELGIPLNPVVGCTSEHTERLIPLTQTN